MSRERLPLPEPVICNPANYCASRHAPLYTADQMHAYADAETAALREQVVVISKANDELNAALLKEAHTVDELRDALEDASNRMDRARDILTDGKPTPECNWGMLATEPARAALEATK